MCLPYDMSGFYKLNIDFVSDHAVDPDKRRYAIKEEAPRHYIDIDRYGEHPFDSLPQSWEEAEKKYSKDSLNAHGILPWHINLMFYRLVNAFKQNNPEAILKLSADIGHYIADAHVPLHTTKNYNGQLTGQRGIHGLWESRIPELMEPGYNYWIGKAIYLRSPLQAAWKAVQQSYAAKDSVLGLEKELSKRFPDDLKYTHETKGKKKSKTYSREYVREYDKLLNGMVERRLKAAIHLVACFWYTAWVDAGQPDLDKLNDNDILEPVPDNSADTNTFPVQLPSGHEDE